MASIASKIFENICEALATSTAAAPTTAYTGGLPSKTVKKGSHGTDVKHLQKFLNWCIGAGLKVDGACGSKTVKAIKKFQKAYGLKQDGVFGSKSRAKAKSIVNAHKPPQPAPTPTPQPTTNAQMIVAKALEYAWPYGTSASKYKYPKGSAKSVYKSALKECMGKKAKISQTDCGYFASTCARAAGHKGFLALPGSYKEKYPKLPSTMYIAMKGKATNLLPGDIIRYRKSGGQHVVVYLGGGKIASAARKHAFPRVSKGKPWTGSKVKKSTIQVVRAK